MRRIVLMLAALAQAGTASAGELVRQIEREPVPTWNRAVFAKKSGIVQELRSERPGAPAPGVILACLDDLADDPRYRSRPLRDAFDACTR